MPPKKHPKKAEPKREREEVEKQEAQLEEIRTEDVGENEEEPQDQAGEKRKEPPTDTKADQPSQKAPKIQETLIDTSKIISFLLSDEALNFLHNLTADLRLPKSSSSTTDPDAKTYFSGNLTPFKHLICALILSRPLSHNLGQRTIATVLNPPWSWNNAQKVIEAGKETKDLEPSGRPKTERVEAMEEARTQHRQKTAAQLGGLAQTTVDEKWDEDGDGSMRGFWTSSREKTGKVIWQWKLGKC